MHENYTLIVRRCQAHAKATFQERPLALYSMLWHLSEKVLSVGCRRNKNAEGKRASQSPSEYTQRSVIHKKPANTYILPPLVVVVVFANFKTKKWKSTMVATIINIDSTRYSHRNQNSYRNDKNFFHYNCCCFSSDYWQLRWSKKHVQKAVSFSVRLEPNALVHTKRCDLGMWWLEPTPCQALVNLLDVNEEKDGSTVSRWSRCGLSEDP